MKPTIVELFAGAGGMALGMEMAGLQAVAINEFDKAACKTLRHNRPLWNIIEGDVRNIDFSYYAGTDVISGGFPCQAFSYAGNQLGFNDVRGTLFYEFARAIVEIKPKIFIAENVRGLLNHDGGKTIATIISVFESVGYRVLEPKLLNANHHGVAQKRERLFIVGIRNDLSDVEFNWPVPDNTHPTLRDALKAGGLFHTDVPSSPGQTYSEKKRKILDMVPPGGYWKDLPLDVQKEYMKKSFYLGGGKTGMARRLSWDNPSLTLTCSPSQNQTERCHPDETRPLTIREYARIQSFPDDWGFCGSISAQYRQIGNAVPVQLAKALGKSIIEALQK
jgi:DNA (cytosine-5)-methyltransferase 1